MDLWTSDQQRHLIFVENLLAVALDIFQNGFKNKQNKKTIKVTQIKYF